MAEQNVMTMGGEREAVPLAKRAAKTSWQMWVLTVLTVMFGNQFGLGMLTELAALVFILVGLGAGVAGLCGIPRHGVRGILAPALAGIVLSGLMLAIFVTNFVASYQGARG